MMDDIDRGSYLFVGLAIGLVVALVLNGYALLAGWFWNMDDANMFLMHMGLTVLCGVFGGFVGLLIYNRKKRIE